MNYPHKIEISQYDDGRPCLSVHTDNGEALIVTISVDELDETPELDDSFKKYKCKTLLDLPMLQSLSSNIYLPLEGVVYHGTGEFVPVKSAGHCLMEIVEINVPEGMYTLADGKLVKVE